MAPNGEGAGDVAPKGLLLTGAAPNAGAPNAEVG